LVDLNLDPPQDIQITSTKLKIFEGDSIKEHRILCKAAGHPEPSYLWKVSNTGHVISFGPHLFSNRSTFKLTRKHAGNYTCTAANKHGSASANFSLVVLCK
jgi:neuromusculin, putative (fragment)